ncbi:hypothetical protein IE53DRAFT_387153 [Violaceomyces palustris]|uniref:Uncharacterized protein n=1 Tax=Violaceomyces palustris TaxID=1673888 RepID=A0ACD0NXL9_9BASI|nr:hypothetical protein IE53DRAFT_387153 [Violaceomyces palustris]
MKLKKSFLPSLWTILMSMVKGPTTCFSKTTTSGVSVGASPTTSHNLKVDLHTHHLPPVYKEALLAANYTHIDGFSLSAVEGNAFLWTPQAHQDLNARVGIEKSYLSITSPGVHLVPGEDRAAAELAREVNDYTASLCRDKPEEFGMFASLPLPDLDASLDEVRRMRRRWNVNAFVVLSNAHGVYIGDEALGALYEELNEARSVVLVHPTSPCLQLHKAAPLNQSTSSWPPNAIYEGSEIVFSDHRDRSPRIVHANPTHFIDPMIEFPFETARVAAKLVLNGIVSKYPHIRWILPHGGGALLPLVERIGSLAQGSSYLQARDSTTTSGSDDRNQTIPQEAEDSFADQVRRFYFDLAGFPMPHQLPSLLDLFPSLEEASHKIVYGSDYVWTTSKTVERVASQLEEGLPSLLGGEKHLVTRIWRGNAQALMNGQ